MVSVTLTIPKPILEFLQSVQVDIEGYFVVSIVNTVEADLEEWIASHNNVFNECNLEPVFSKYSKSAYPFSTKVRQKMAKEHRG